MRRTKPVTEERSKKKNAEILRTTLKDFPCQWSNRAPIFDLQTRSSFSPRSILEDRRFSYRNDLFAEFAIKFNVFTYDASYLSMANKSRVQNATGDAQSYFNTLPDTQSDRQKFMWNVEMFYGAILPRGRWRRKGKQECQISETLHKYVRE